MGSRITRTSRATLSIINKGNIDATLAANLPSNPQGGDAYRVTVAGSFENDSSIDPASSYFDIGDFIVWNQNTSKWNLQDMNEVVSDSSYDDTTWNGETRLAPSKNAIRDQLNARSTALGINANGTYSAHSGTNYLDAATTAKGARELLDTRTYQATRPHPNGWEDNSKVVVSYDLSSKIFTVSILSGAAYWAGGVRYTPTADNYNTSAHSATTGVWWVLYRGETLTVTQTPSFETDAIIAYAYYNATDPTKSIWFDERHPDTWPWSVHQYEHTHNGSVIVSGGTLSGYTLSTSTDAANTYAISQTVLDDESLRNTLTALADNGPYTIWYRSGTVANNEWSWVTTPVVPYISTGTGPQFNDISGASATNSNLTSVNYYVNYYLVATNAYNDGSSNYKHRFVLVMGQAEHSTLASAQAESVADLSWGTLPFTEGAPMYKITLKRVATGTTVETTRITNIQSVGLSIIAASTPASHSALSNRDAVGSHPDTAISTTQSGTNYLDAVTDVNTALSTLDSAAGNIQTEVNNIETGAGLETDGTLAAFSGTNYIDAAASLKAAISTLDSKIKSEAIKYAIALGG